MALDLEDIGKACAAVRCSPHRRSVNSFAHLSFERPRLGSGDGRRMVFDRLGGQAVSDHELAMPLVALFRGVVIREDSRFECLGSLGCVFQSDNDGFGGPPYRLHFASIVVASFGFRTAASECVLD